jgi:ribosomal protein S19
LPTGVWVLQKKAAPEGDKPAPVKTHLRNMVIIPEMIGSVIGVYNGKVFLPVEVKVGPVTMITDCVGGRGVTAAGYRLHDVEAPLGLGLGVRQ